MIHTLQKGGIFRHGFRVPRDNFSRPCFFPFFFFSLLFHRARKSIYDTLLFSRRAVFLPQTGAKLASRLENFLENYECVNRRRKQGTGRRIGETITGRWNAIELEWSTSNGEKDLKRGGEEKKRNLTNLIDRNWFEFANEMDLEMDHEGTVFGDLLLIPCCNLVPTSLYSPPSFVGYSEKKNPARFSNSGLNSISWISYGLIEHRLNAFSFFSPRLWQRKNENFFRPSLLPLVQRLETRFSFLPPSIALCVKLGQTVLILVLNSCLNCIGVASWDTTVCCINLVSPPVCVLTSFLKSSGTIVTNGREFPISFEPSESKFRFRFPRAYSQ